MPRTGLLHAHSRFSYDGEHTLKDLAAIARGRSFDFIGMTEHAETLDRDQMHEFVRECRTLSDQGFLVIPGVEFVCAGDLHILGFGIEQLTDSKDAVTVARFIQQQDGLAVVAHPSRNGYKIPEEVWAAVDGIEIWNARYDGWFVPNDYAIALWKQRKRGGGAPIAIGGQDLHEMKARGHVKVMVTNDELSRAAILQALKSGDFRISNSYLTLHPATLGRRLPLVSIACARRLYLGARFIARPIKKRLLTLRKGRLPLNRRGHGV
jgi:PHP domain